MCTEWQRIYNHIVDFSIVVVSEAFKKKVRLLCCSALTLSGNTYTELDAETQNDIRCPSRRTAAGPSRTLFGYKNARRAAYASAVMFIT